MINRQKVLPFAELRMWRGRGGRGREVRSAQVCMSWTEVPVKHPSGGHRQVYINRQAHTNTQVYIHQGITQNKTILQKDPRYSTSSFLKFKPRHTGTCNGVRYTSWVHIVAWACVREGDGGGNTLGASQAARLRTPASLRGAGAFEWVIRHRGECMFN